MPWAPELFSAPALSRIWEDERIRRLELVPFFAGLMTGEIGAVIDSFAGEPELHHPVRGRIRGAAAFERYAAETRDWLAGQDGVAEDVEFVLTPGRGVEEVLLRLDAGRAALPVAIVSDHDDRGRITEQRMYFSRSSARGGAVRPPLLQPGGVRAGDVVGEYHRALAAGDVEAAVAAFEPDGYVREPTGDGSAHRGADELRALLERLGAIGIEQCAVTDDGRACALEYNVVARGPIAQPPEAGLTVYVRSDSGRLAAARIYEPPVRSVDGGPTQ